MDFAAIADSERDRREQVHSEIFAAARAGDLGATRRTVRAHLRANESELIERIETLIA